MKIRLQENSIRFRLKQAEVNRLRERGTLDLSLSLPGGAGKLAFAIRIDGTEARITKPQDTVLVEIPSALAGPWLETEEISLALELPGPDGALQVLVEKDLPCRHPEETRTANGHASATTSTSP